MALRFGDVIVVPFPFTDQTAIKRRPAVVVSSERYNRERPDLRRDDESLRDYLRSAGGLKRAGL
jgi:hypothetical protein